MAISPTPPPYSVLPPTPSPALLGANEVAVEVLSAPRPTPSGRIIGEIQEVRPDGTLRIRTDAGDMLVRVQNEARTQPGQRVEINLPTTDTSEQGQSGPSTIRAAPVRSETSSPPASPPPTTDPAATVPSTPVTPDGTGTSLANISRGQKTTSHIPLPDLSPEQIIQLQPLTASQVRGLIATNTDLLQKLLLAAMGSTATEALTVSVGNNAHRLTSATGSIANPTTLAPTNIIAPDLESAMQSLGILQMRPDTVLPRAGAVPIPPAPTDIPTLFSPTSISAPTLAKILAFAPPGGDVPPPITIFSTPTTTAENTTHTNTPQTYLVLGSNTQGQHILQALPTAPPQTTSMTYAITTTQSTPLPPGTIIQTVSVPTSTPLTQVAATPSSTRTIWPSLASSLLDDLDEILLSLSAPNTAGNLASIPRMLIPNIQQPQQLGPAILFFMAAIRSGDTSTWLGEKAIDDLKRAGKGAALERLGETIGSLRRAIDTASTDWKSYLIPAQFGAEIKPIMLMIKQDGGQGQNHTDQRGKRFVLQVEFDRMGPVQLDLLYRPQQLDTILRTELPLSRAMGTILAQKYAAAMEQVGHTGELYLQPGFKNWVMVSGTADPLQLLV